MCIFPKAPKDNSAEIARQQEAARQAKIAQGRERIDASFQPFTDDFFDNRSREYLEYQQLQLQQQYEQARRKLMLGLPQGALTSSAGARSMSDLNRINQQKMSEIGAAAQDFGQQERNRVAQAREELMALNTGSVDPADLAVQAANRAGSFMQAPKFSAIGDVFSNFLNTAATGVALQKQGYPGLGIPLPTPDVTGSGSGSGKVVF